jgi:hypothetical protein
MAREFLGASAAHRSAATTIQKLDDKDTAKESDMAPRSATDMPARETRAQRRRATSSRDTREGPVAGQR